MIRLNENLYSDSGWEIYEKSFREEQLIATGSNFLTGNGYLGYRGTFPEWRRDKYVGCIVTDTYDNADGTWTELCNAPNGLYTKLVVDGEAVDAADTSLSADETAYYRKIDLRYGIFSAESSWIGINGRQLYIGFERFVSYANLHLVPMRYKIRAGQRCRVELYTGIDGVVWDLNGNHLYNYKMEAEEGETSITAETGQSGISLAVCTGYKIRGNEPLKKELVREEKAVFWKLTFELEQEEEIVIEKVMTVYSSNDTADPYSAGKKSLHEALASGYEQLKDEHKPYWDRIWEKADIKINGDPFSQVLLRFNLYHNIIATPAHSDALPIGARGLSCQAYQGAAFWDQEIFNLPMFIYTIPEVARNILIYRYNTLDGARRKAAKLGYKGAFYAWVSGKTGDELCPSFFFTDVLTGRRIRNHFNDWQIHVSPDLVYAIWQYYQATGDWKFIEDYGAEIIFEVARFLYSFAYYKKDKNQYELIRVLGPDEYHENVDNNAFTNYQVRFSLEKALEVYGKLKATNAELWRKITGKIFLTEEDFLKWKEMAEKLYLPQPDPKSGVIEQFRGYLELENVLPEELEKRLLDRDEYWGWPNGVAVHTRVIKQADVLQLLVLQNIYSKEIFKANYNYYEPRCQHGSSLSPSVHSIIAAKIGYLDEAYKYFIRSCVIDLFNTNKALSGGTFIGGIHIAACGAAWQMIIFGFAGMEVMDQGISFCPNLPEQWNNMEFSIIYQQQWLHLSLGTLTLKIKSDPGNNREVAIRVFGKTENVQPGESANFEDDQANSRHY